MRILFAIPFILFVLVCGYFFAGLGQDSRKLPSVLIDQPVPQFKLSGIEAYKEGFSSNDLTGEVSLVNIFGSWCISCEYEHPVLMKIKGQGVVKIFGLDWRDTPENAKKWLQRLGDPYERIGNDLDGRVAIDFGVTGAPETYVIDANGQIRYKHSGPITNEIWSTQLLPLVERLKNEKAGSDSDSATVDSDQ